jgi:hypothetical protein
MGPHNSLPADIFQLDELEILVVVDNETDTLSSVDVGVPQVPEVIHLAARTPTSRKYQGTNARLCLTSCAAPVMASRC